MILADLGKEQLNILVQNYGEKSFRAGQIYNNINNGKSISQMTDLSESFRQKLLQDYADCACEIYKEFHSKDGSIKYLFKLSDGNLIEGVLMKYKYGYTQCVSAQVGCRMGCEFCASTIGGLVRNLTSGEILSQIAVVNRALGGDIKKRLVTNVVLMGSGEPFDNYDNVVDFLKKVTCSGGLNISARNISLSTCGLVDKIYDFCNEGIALNLTISLHSPFDEQRKKIMPIAKKYKISQILSACEQYFKVTKRRYIFEYSLIKGQNDSDKDLQELYRLLKGKPCHVNLIRLNEVKEKTLKSVNDKNAYDFCKKLNDLGISSTVRRIIGSDIQGACGQLRASVLKGEDDT